MLFSSSDKVAIWRPGVEGIATLKFIRSKFKLPKVTVIDDNPECLDSEKLAKLASLDASVEKTSDIRSRLEGGEFDWLILTPGISLYREEVQRTIKSGTKLTSSTNIWLSHYSESSTIVVTGTKGKSTTSSMLCHVLSNLGLRCKLVGNIGRPLISESPADDYTIIELSSYQLASCYSKVKTGLIINLSPEHMPWHGSVEQYYIDKLNIVNISEKLFLNMGCRRLESYFENKKKLFQGGGKVIPFGERSSKGRNSDLDQFKDLISRKSKSWRGEHNIDNAYAVTTLVESLGLASREKMVDIICSFKPLKHRLEEIGVYNDVLCINDSISTTPEATLAAVKSFKDYNIALIVGGGDRGHEYREFASQLAEHSLSSVYVVPETGLKIAELLKNKKPCFPVIICSSIEEAVEEYFNNPPQVSSVADTSGTNTSRRPLLLLSPAATSFNAFRNYEHRATVFKDSIEKATI